MNAFEVILKQLQKLAPELHRVSNVLLNVDGLYLVAFILNFYLNLSTVHALYAFILLQVHYLRYLNSLYHDDYFAALENLHCYFDYR